MTIISSPLENKEQALQSISKMIEQFDISINDIQKLQKKRKESTKDIKWINKLFGYLGAAFIFGGLCLLIGMIWSDLGSAARVIISYGSGLCAFICGYVFTRDEKYENLSFPSYLISTFLLPFGMFVFLHEYVGGKDAQLAIIIVFGILAIQFAIPFLKDKKTSLLFFAYLFFYISLGAFLPRMHIPQDIAGLGIGLSIIGFAFYFDKTIHRPICPFWYFVGVIIYIGAISLMMFKLDLPNELIGVIIGITVMLFGWHFKESQHNVMAPIFYVFGALGFLLSLFEAVENKPFFDLIFLAIAVYMMIISVRIKSRGLLVVSTLAIIAFLGYFTKEYFANVTGWPIALIIFGFFLIGTSHYALKLGQKISSTKKNATSI